MKRKFLPLTLALLISLLLALPTAAAEYGVVYTESDHLQSDELSALGQYDLPQFTENYGIDLRVDVLTSLVDFDTVEEAAPAIYDNYGYGYGDGMNGVSLTLLVHEDEDGVAMDEWYVYAAGDSDELTTNGIWNVFPVLDDLMIDENWAGDARQDTQTLVAAVTAMKDGLESFVLSGGVADTIWDPNTGFTVSEAAPSDAPDSWPAAGEQIGYVTDTAGIMTAAQRQELEQMAQTISDKHGFGVYLMTVNSFREATDSYAVDDGAVTLYKKYDLGMGEEQKGILLLLSMKGRDFSLVTYSDYGNYVFDEWAREGMTTYFLDDFADDDWYSGFADYLASCDEILTDGPDKLQSEITGLTGIIFLFPLIIAAVVISVLGRRMKSVAKATQAEVYAKSGLELSNSYDRFTHATETRRKRKSESSGGGGGGRTRSSSSGGFGRTSGKF